MTAQVIELAYRRRGWRMVIAQCASCHARAVVMQQLDCPLDHCACPECGAFAWGVTHLRRDGKFVPRVEALS